MTIAQATAPPFSGAAWPRPQLRLVDSPDWVLVTRRSSLSDDELEAEFRMFADEIDEWTRASLPLTHETWPSE